MRDIQELLAGLQLTPKLLSGFLQDIPAGKIPAPILKFNTTLVRELAALVLDRLKPDQRRAIENIVVNLKRAA